MFFTMYDDNQNQYKINLEKIEFIRYNVDTKRLYIKFSNGYEIDVIDGENMYSILINIIDKYNKMKLS